MGTLSLAIQLFIVFLITSYLLNKYSTIRKQNVIVTLFTFIGWFFSLIIIFVLPLDVAITFYHKCETDRAILLNDSKDVQNCELPGGFVPDEMLLDLWRIVYWTAQILTWLILPLLQSYVTAGDFTACGKLKTSILNNLLYYGLYSLCFLALLIYAMFKGVSINYENLKVIIVSASNTWGLFLLVVLLGYGLVELPRSLWHHGNRHYRLRKTYFDIEKLASEKSEAEENVKELYKKLCQMKQGDCKIKIILSKFDESVINKLLPSRQSVSNTADNGPISEVRLINLHRKSINAIQALNNSNAQWKLLVDRALFLENLALSSGSELQLEKGGIVPVALRMLWYTKLQTPLSKACSLIFGVMTLFVLLSECTFFVVSPTLSPAALVTEYSANRFHYKYTQFVAFGIIVYLCLCAYFTIFRLRIYKYYHLDPNGLTDENSILFSAILLCRLTPPICLNFLGMIHMDSHISMARDFGVETQFTKLMGHLDVIPILAKGINIYLPICIILICVVHYYKVGTYLLHSLGFDQFVESDDMTNDMINAGRSLVQIERNSLRRENERTHRNEQFNLRNSALSTKYTKLTSKRSKGPFDEERPMLEGSDDDSPTRHPSSSGFFDDM